MSRTDHQKVEDDASAAVRDDPRMTFVTGIPLGIAFAWIVTQMVFPVTIGWLFIGKRPVEGLVLIALATCLLWFSGVLGYRCLRCRHWIFAFFCLGPMVAVAGVILFCSSAKFERMLPGDIDGWILAGCISAAIILGLMIDLEHPAPPLRRQLGSSSALAITGASMLVVSFFVMWSFGLLELAGGCAVALGTLTWYHAGMWKIRTARRRADENEAGNPHAPEGCSKR